MGQIRDRMVADLALRGAARNTCKAYLRYARAFVAFHRRSPADLGTEHVRAWVLHLLPVTHRNPRTVNVAIAALRFLFDTTLQRPDVMASMRAVRVQHRQPDVPSGSQVAALLANARTPKHRAIFLLLYGAGLRVSEVLRLTPADIDSQRMVVHVRDPKNRHDRIVPLPPTALAALRTYWRADRPTGPALFAGQAGRGVLSREAVHRAVRQAGGAAGLTIRVYPHLLRHYSAHWIIPRSRLVWADSRCGCIGGAWPARDNQSPSRNARRASSGR
jgi:integrase/recombinase XerD